MPPRDKSEARSFITNAQYNSKLTFTMDVPQEDLYNTLPYMLSLAQDARFVVIDLEMSGIGLDSTRSSSPSTSPQEVYIQAKKAAELFAIVEVGLTFIQYDERTCKF